MRLDHLLSTENFRLPCWKPVCAPCAWNGSTVSHGDAGVEEIMGLDGIRPVREWCGYAFGLPDRHPTVVSLWRGLLPMRSSRDVRWMFGGTCGAWWFENWIVDASKRN